MPSYSPCQILYQLESILFNWICEKLALDVDLDVLDALTECLYNQAELFKQAMDMAIEKLSITQYCGTLRYACIYSSTYWS